LPAAFEINDAETSVCQPNLRGAVKANVIRTSMPNGSNHSAEHVTVDEAVPEINDPTDSAH
jgi:hypothetical protein